MIQAAPITRKSGGVAQTTWKPRGDAKRSNSSGDDHPAQVVEKKVKKRKFSVKAGPGDALAGGLIRVSQPTGRAVRILLVDAGAHSEAAWRGEGHKLAMDMREQEEVSDILDAACILDAHVIAGTDFPEDDPPGDSLLQGHTPHDENTSWHVWCDPEFWTVMGFQVHSLSTKNCSESMNKTLQDRACAEIDLVNEHGDELFLMIVKVLRGCALEAPSLHLRPFPQEEILEALFDFFGRDNPGPTLVAGDIGAGVGQLHHYMRIYQSETTLETHCNEKQNLHAFFEPTTTHWGEWRSIKLTAPSNRMLMLQMVLSSGDPHPTETAKKTKRCEEEPLELLNLFGPVDHTASKVDDAYTTVSLLYRPVSLKIVRADGLEETGPIDVHMSVRTFANSLKLMKKVRAEAGVDRENTTLSSVQSDKALASLKLIFEQNYIRSETLQQNVRSMAVDPDMLSRKDKKALRNGFRGAFRVWASAVFGDFNFLRVMLRHGLFDFSDQRRCVQMLRDERQKASGRKQVHTVPDKRLREEAVRAQKAVRDANAFQRWQFRGDHIQDWQAKQIILLGTGALEKEMVAANRAYGFGKGAELTLSRDQAVTLEVCTYAPLRAYFA